MDADKIENDISEDEREEKESLTDLEKDKGGEKHEINDVSEDERETSESIEDLKELLKTALLENAKKDAEIKQLQDDLNEAHRVFITQPREDEKEERTFDTINNNIKR